MPFQKADPKQAYLKIGLYGPQGSGKTFTALLVAEGLAKRMGKRVAFIDTERGTDFYAQHVAERAVHPEPFDFDVSYSSSLSDALHDVKGIDLSVYGVVVIDSISALWDAAIAAYEGKKTKIDSIPMSAWGKIKKPYKDLVRSLVDMNAHVFILGRQKNIFKNDEHVGVGMRAEGETEYEPHICCRLESMRKPDGTAGGSIMIVEKDRSGVLHGRTIPNANFNTFTPLLQYLGDEQAQSEDSDEVASRDSDLLNDESKERAKGEKSEKIYTDLNSKITMAASLPSLGEIATELTKNKRYLTEEHLASLRLVYSNRHNQLSTTAAPQEV
jgi:hypothetical protein